MSNPSWLNSLTQTLRRPQKSDWLPRVAIVGVGHELCGDDAAGIKVARTLQPLVASRVCDRLLVIEAGPAPENCTGSLRYFEPDLVLLVDAAQMDEAPGTVRWLAWQTTTGLGASTHTLPLHVLSRYLTVEFDCEVALLGIQPANTTTGTSLSPAVQQAVNTVVQTLAEMLPC